MVYSVAYCFIYSQIDCHFICVLFFAKGVDYGIHTYNVTEVFEKSTLKIFKTCDFEHFMRHQVYNLL